MAKNTILLLFPDGVGIRNYLYSDVFKNSDSELCLFHDFDETTIEEIKAISKISNTLKIPRYRESFKEKFLRELICLSRLNHNAKVTGNKSILTNWKASHNTLRKRIFYKIVEKVALLINRYGSIIKLEKAYQQAIRFNPFYDEVKKILKEIKPDQVFCSHQRGLKCATIFAVAKELGIETVTVIYSWDNLPKARMALRADKYLVWSDYMKEEMQLYYPEIPQSQVHVTGTPQFEFYKDSSNIFDRDTFYSKYKLDPNKKIICYSGDDILTSPDDPKYLQDLAESLVDAALDSEYQILLRRCPVDLTGRFDDIAEKFPSLIKTAPPLWNFKEPSAWTTVYPLPEDVTLLVSTAYYSDIVVNVGSTMGFDFCMFDKPCVFINYDQSEKKVEHWSVDTIYQFQHFKSMTSSKAVSWLNGANEIVDILKRESTDLKEMKKWKTVVLGNHDNVSERIQNILKL